MQATHPTYYSERQALTEANRLERLGKTVSQPYQDQHGRWRLTVLHYGDFHNPNRY